MPKKSQYKGWYVDDNGMQCPYNEAVGGPKKHPDCPDSYMQGIHFFWDERKGVLHFSEAGRCFDDHGVGKIEAKTIEEAEFLIGKFIHVGTT